MLTGKAKEDFERWYSDTDSEIKHSLQKSLFYSKAYIERYAYYLEWLDSVGIRLHVWPVPHKDGFIWDGYINMDIQSFWETRQEATKELILKANKIYNER